MSMSARQEFLLRMYDQMFNDINRHIMVVWQSIGLVIGAFALLSLVEKDIVPLDIASSLIACTAFWAAANHTDSSYWYNRNLCIIANIERQFLEEGDLRSIHYYWGSHRPKNRMIYHLKIQQWLVFSIAVLVLVFHFAERVAPGLSQPFSHFEIQRALPYLVAIAGFAMLLYVQSDRNASYEEFLRNSPGATVDTEGVEYGRGHGFYDEDVRARTAKLDDAGATPGLPAKDHGRPDEDRPEPS